MDELCRMVEKAVPVVRWFAMTEAKLVAAEGLGAVGDYRAAPDNKERLVQVAKNMSRFLMHRGTAVAFEHHRMLRDKLEALGEIKS